MRESVGGRSGRNALALLANLILLSCPGPLDRDRARPLSLTVGFTLSGSSTSRTIVPDYSTALARIAKLQATLESDDGYPKFSATDSDGAPWELGFDPTPGSWDITVVLLDAVDAEIGRGTIPNFQVTSGSMLTAAVPITFASMGSTGDVSLKVSVPNTTGVDYVQGRLMKTPEIVDEATLTRAGEKKTGDLAFSSLDTGTYTLMLTFKRGGSTGLVAGIFREKIVVVGGYTSSSWVECNGDLVSERTFTEDELFYNPNTALAGLVINSGGTLSSIFDPATIAYNVFCASFPATVSFTATGSVGGQSLRYAMNAGAITTMVSAEPVSLSSVISGDVLRVWVKSPDGATESTYRFSFGKAGGTSYPVTGGSVIFTLSAGKQILTSYSAAPRDATIPSAIGGYPVTGIGENAFLNCSSLKFIDLPDSITAIGKHAFFGCSGLTSLDIPTGVTVISEGSIQNCTSLTTVVIPSSVATIQSYAFYNSPSLTALHIKAAKPPDLSSNQALNGGTPGFKIYVPAANVADYEKALVWKNFAIVGE